MWHLLSTCHVRRIIYRHTYRWVRASHKRKPSASALKTVKDSGQPLMEERIWRPYGFLLLFWVTNGCDETVGVRSRNLTASVPAKADDRVLPLISTTQDLPSACLCFSFRDLLLCNHCYHWNLSTRYCGVKRGFLFIHPSGGNFVLCCAWKRSIDFL